MYTHSHTNCTYTHNIHMYVESFFNFFIQAHPVLHILIKTPTNFKKEAYRDGIKRKRYKIGMGCSTCFTYDFHIVSVVTFPESTSRSLYCRLVCLTQTLLLCRILSLSLVHKQLILTYQLYRFPLWWDRLSSHLVSLQVNMKFTHMVNVLLGFHNRDCVVDSGNVTSLTM